MEKTYSPKNEKQSNIIYIGTFANGSFVILILFDSLIHIPKLNLQLRIR